MELERQLIAYIGETLHEQIDLERWSGAAALPHLLRDAYRFLEAVLCGKRVIFLLPSSGDDASPRVLAAHAALIRERSRLEPVIVLDSLPAYNRARLVKHGVSFVTPGNQMYLLPLGIDFRETYRAPRRKSNTVYPATQAVAISLLTRHLPLETYTQTETADRMGYSPMTISRAIRELEEAGFLRHRTAGRSRVVSLADNDRRAAWERLVPRLASPVRSTARIAEPGSIQEIALPAGLSALSHHTAIAPPRNHVLAMDGTAWRTATREGLVTELPPYAEEGLTVQIWTYGPIPWHGTVDPLSLVLSLQADRDERIQSAVDGLLGEFPW